MNKNLLEIELFIDPMVLKHKTDKNKFKMAVLSLQKIVKLKLYKKTFRTLDGYIKSKWNYSRAQVYRLLDCALVITVCFVINQSI